MFGSGDAHQQKQDEPKPAADAGDVLDELSLNESIHYKQKVTKYLRTAVRCIHDVSFWYFMFSGNAMRSPLLHFYAVLCTPTSQADCLVVQMVTQKTTEISNEFNELLRGFVSHIDEALQFANSVQDGNLLDDDSEGTLRNWITGSLAILLHNAGAFHRRVTLQFTRSEIVCVCGFVCLWLSLDAICGK